MVPKRLFSWMHKVALFAIVFASLAPSISHALAAQQGTATFSQEICTAGGRVISVQVVSSEGQKLGTGLESEKRPPSPARILHHLNHCPFCANPKIDHGMTALYVPMTILLETQVQQRVVSAQAVLPRFSVLPPPAQGPPSIN